MLCTIDVVVRFRNMPFEEGLASLRRSVDARTKKKVTTETSRTCRNCFKEYNLFSLMKKTLKQLRGTATGTKFCLPHIVQFYLWLTLRKEVWKTLSCSHTYV